MDGGIETDRSDPQFAKARSPRTDALDSGSNVTLDRKWQYAKQPDSIRSKMLEMQKSASPAKQRTRAAPSKSVTEFPRDLKKRFSGSILTARTPVAAIAEPSKFRTVGGTEIDLNDEHPKNARWRKVESLEPGSIVTQESPRQKVKHESPMVSTDDGIQMDSRVAQFENAKSPKAEILEFDSNVT
jgi:hypothetical protein